jgi:hypothetical protein
MHLQLVSLVLKLFFYNKVVYIQNASVSCLPSAPEGGINSGTLFLQREQLHLKYKSYHLKKEPCPNKCQSRKQFKNNNAVPSYIVRLDGA